MKKSAIGLIFFALLIVPSLIFCLFSCTEENPSEAGKERRIYLSSINLNLDVADSHQLTVSENCLDDGAKIKWTSSSPEVAVCEDGLVTAVSPGTARISAESDGAVTAYCVVSVRENVKRFINIDRIEEPIYLEYTDPETGRVVGFEVSMTLYDQNDNNEPHFRCQYNAYQSDILDVRVQFLAKKVYDSGGDNATTAFTYYMNLYKEDGEFCEVESLQKSSTAIKVGESVTYVMEFNAYIFNVAREFYFEIDTVPHG